MNKPIAILVLACLAAAALAQQAKMPTLKVGDPAPAMKIAKWVKGTPVPKFEKGKVYVVEFWATWCGPCKESIPHLTELAHKYKGKATFTGVDAFEEPSPKDTSYFKKVDQFVNDMGAKMDYNVAIDGQDGVMGKSWMDAAGQDGIPTAFVVDQNGMIVWIGHPMVGLDEAVGQVIEGKFDTKAEAERQKQAADARDAQAALQQKMMELMKPVEEALQAGNTGDAITELDKVFKVHPDMEQQLAGFKFGLLMQADEPKAYAYAKQLSEGLYKDNSMQLNGLAWAIVDDKSPAKHPDLALAITLAQKALDLLPKDDDQNRAYTLDTLAYAQFKNGEIDKAIENETQSVALVEKAGTKVDPQTKKDITDRLAQFKKKKAGGR